jgi:hypothetical protein
VADCAQAGGVNERNIAEIEHEVTVVWIDNPEGLVDQVCGVDVDVPAQPSDKTTAASLEGDWGNWRIERAADERAVRRHAEILSGLWHL